MKQKQLFILLLGVFLLLLFSMPAVARSLWNDSSNLVADQRPRNVGDIVTVVVDEKTKTKDQGKTDVSKTNNSSVADGLGILDFIRAFGFSSKTNMKGDGSTERTHSARTQITCLVTDTLPTATSSLRGRGT